VNESLGFLLVTIPVSLLLAVALLAVVIHAVRTGAFDDWDGPAQRHVLDDDSVPEREGEREGEAESRPAR
jgi:cbb3-type cytochrome oxidase maturation protein